MDRPAPLVTVGGRRPRVAAAVALAAAGLAAALGGCERSVDRQASLELAQPRTSGGVFLDSDDPVRLRDVAAALDELDYMGTGPDGRVVRRPEPVLPEAFPAGRADLPRGAADAVTDGASDASGAMERRRGVEELVAAADPADPADAAAGADPPGSGGADADRTVEAEDPDDEETAGDDAAAAGARPDPGDRWSSAAATPPRLPAPPEPPLGSVELIELPRLSDVELTDMLDRLVLEVQSVRGYVEATGDRTLAARLPSVPRGVQSVVTLVRPAAERIKVLRVGRRTFASQPPQLWILGVSIGRDGGLESNDDLSLLRPVVDGAIAAMQVIRDDLGVLDLEKTLVKLSYVDADSALSTLAGMGILTVDAPEEMPEQVTFERLPIVLKMPDPSPESRGLVGADLQVGRGEFGVSLTPSVAGQLNDDTIASPTTQLMVLWHPAHPGQFSRVRALIDDYIDRPAKQIFVEGLVLEISDEGLKDLGIEWQLNEGPVNWRFGSPRADGQTDTLDLQQDDLDFWRVFTRDFEWKWSLRIRSLIEDKKAEVLSRPSVLTLDNRQSTIRVGEDIPIATSTEGTAGNTNRISFSFKYLPTGILLNIRPRVNEANDEVSMLIDTIVSAVVPNADLVIRSNEGDELASAPTVSTRRVQTYARIRNNTPFIIGGLVSREDSTTVDKVPLLGDLPLVGNLFRAERAEREKREVIIVLTPFILPDDSELARTLPKADDLFDTVGQTLFRDSYRIRPDDVLDVHFLQDSEHLQAYRERARTAIRRNFTLAEREPFRSFDGDRMPGERVLVTRMIHSMIARLGVDAAVRVDRTVLLEGRRASGYDVRFLSDVMARLSGSVGYESFFRKYPGRALVIQWTWDPEMEDDVETRPVPQISVVACPDREAWRRLSWELNRPRPDGMQRASVVLASEEDVVRLRRALALRRTVELNGGWDAMTLSSVNVGRVLLVPDFDDAAVHVLDREVARAFAHTAHTEGTVLEAMREAMRALDAELAEPARPRGLRPGSG